MLFSEIHKVVGGAMSSKGPNTAAVDILYLSTDSRLVKSYNRSLFFAIQGNQDGHSFIEDLYQKGLRSFIIDRPISFDNYPLASFIQVDRTIDALQRLAIHHRSSALLQVVGITGSNAKTTVKEWLSELLSAHLNVVKTPKSYNSQIGVPISIWQIQPHHQLGVFEAGISKPGEMAALQQMIQPELGIFTNIGPAHDYGFKNWEEKISEKAQLFKGSKGVICCEEHLEVFRYLRSTFPGQLVTWSSSNSSASFFIQLIGKTLLVQHSSQSHSFSLPFDFPIWVENLTHAIVAALYLGTSQADIQARLNYLSPVKMRLSMVHGVNGSYVIDDTYNNDLQGLEVALDYLTRQTEKKVKTLILSDLLDSGLPEKELYLQTSRLVNQAKIDRVYLIGSRITKHTSLIQNVAGSFDSVSEFLTQLPSFSKEIILLKGARRFSFERIVKKIESKSHRTRLEINFEAIIHNLNTYRSVMPPGTKIMAMVKAFGYGSGSSEIASLLQFHNVDYLGVAYTDEAIALRKSGIRVPIMIMSPDEINLDQLSDLQIEAEVYSMERVRSVCEMANPPAIHLKIETGMNRLGLVADEWLPAARLLADHPNVKIAGIFTHLAAADDSRLDEFTIKQIRRFEEAFEMIASTTNQQPLKHLLNTSGVSRFPNTQNDMVRIGIGLYGFDPTHQLQLRSTSTLKTFVTQIKEVKAGEPVGYGCAWTAHTDTRIAIVPIGYADGFDRRNSKGIGYMAWNGKKLPVIGNVCMDMTMLEVGDLTIEPEDPIEIFGETILLEDVAQRIGTIPYEILTSISARVKRVYLSE